MNLFAVIFMLFVVFILTFIGYFAGKEIKIDIFEKIIDWLMGNIRK